MPRGVTSGIPTSIPGKLAVPRSQHLHLLHAVAHTKPSVWSWQSKDVAERVHGSSAVPLVLCPGFGNASVDYVSPFGAKGAGIVAALEVSPAQLMAMFPRVLPLSRCQLLCRPEASGFLCQICSERNGLQLPAAYYHGTHGGAGRLLSRATGEACTKPCSLATGWQAANELVTAAGGTWRNCRQL